MKNIELWDKVCKTDPKFTKRFRRSGGFEGTAINATYLAKVATQEFGPMGIGWGIDILEENYVEGAPIIIGGREVCREVIHKLKAQLWYILDGEVGRITQYGLTTFIGSNKYGVYTDEEAPKESMTDAMTKCLSLLGFSADVYMGMYDDNKYAAQIKQFFEEKRKKEEPKITTEQAEEMAKLLTETKSDVNAFLRWAEIEELEDMPASRFYAVREKLLLKKKTRS